jgi:hypothetical protein
MGLFSRSSSTTATAIRPDLQAALDVTKPRLMSKPIGVANGLLDQSERVLFACMGSDGGTTNKIVVVTDSRLILAGSSLGTSETATYARADLSGIATARTPVPGYAVITVHTRSGELPIKVLKAHADGLAAALR